MDKEPSNVVYEGKVVGIGMEGRAGEGSFQVGKQFSVDEAPFYVAILAAGQSVSSWYNRDGRLLAVKSNRQNISEIVINSCDPTGSNGGSIELPDQTVKGYVAVADHLNEAYGPTAQRSKIYLQIGFEFSHHILEAVSEGRIKPIDEDSQHHVITSLNPLSIVDEKYVTSVPATFKPLTEIVADIEAMSLLSKLARNFQSVGVEHTFTTPDGMHYFVMRYL